MSCRSTKLPFLGCTENSDNVDVFGEGKEVSETPTVESSVHFKSQAAKNNNNRNHVPRPRSLLQGSPRRHSDGGQAIRPNGIVLDGPAQQLGQHGIVQFERCPRGVPSGPVSTQTNFPLMDESHRTLILTIVGSSSCLLLSSVLLFSELRSKILIAFFLLYFRHFSRSPNAATGSASPPASRRTSSRSSPPMASRPSSRTLARPSA